MSLDPVDRMLSVEGDGLIWELFHENSKTSMVERHPVYGLHPSDALVVQMMHTLRTVKQYTDRPKVALPAEWPASTRSFDDVLEGRTSARGFGAGTVPLDRLAKGLLLGYGIIRSNEGTHFPRPFRGVPSGGALYPLEVYLQANRVEGLAPGLYHLDPEERELDVLRTGDESDQVASFMIQPELYRQAAATVFISAVFIRSVFKYADRGYRFVLLEAGHLAQNLLLTWQEAGLAAVTIGGYLDRAADRHLRLDGVNESVVYALHVGAPLDQESPVDP